MHFTFIYVIFILIFRNGYFVFYPLFVHNMLKFFGIKYEKNKSCYCFCSVPCHCRDWIAVVCSDWGMGIVYFWESIDLCIL